MQAMSTQHKVHDARDAATPAAVAAEAQRRLQAEAAARQAELTTFMDTAGIGTGLGVSGGGADGADSGRGSEGASSHASRSSTTFGVASGAGKAVAAKQVQRERNLVAADAAGAMEDASTTNMAASMKEAV
eukprot:936410-Prymnesium_polylepis.1